MSAANIKTMKHKTEVITSQYNDRFSTPENKYLQSQKKLQLILVGSANDGCTGCGSCNSSVIVIVGYTGKGEILAFLKQNKGVKHNILSR